MAKNGASLNWGGLDKIVGQAAHTLADRKQLLSTIGDTLVSSTSKRFEEGRDPAGKAWEPSARAMEQGGKTLADTGRLMQSVDYAVTPDSVMVGSNVTYARIHQLGGKAGRGHKVTIPARPYLGVSKQDKEEVQRIMHSFLATAFKR